MTGNEAFWRGILSRLGLDSKVTASWAPVFAEGVRPTTFPQGVAEMDAFFRLILARSKGLERLEEDLQFHATHLIAKWPLHFPTLHEAMPFANNPVALAGRLYGHRWGNRDRGDGYKYRGRGLLPVRGHDNYLLIGQVLKLPLQTQPDLLLQPRVALQVALAWWHKKIPEDCIEHVVRRARRVNTRTGADSDFVDITA